MGAVLQYHRVCHWNLHQRSYQEEEVGGVEEEGEFLDLLGLSPGPKTSIYLPLVKTRDIDVSVFQSTMVIGARAGETAIIPLLDGNTR